MSVSLEEFDDTASVVHCGNIHGRVSFGGRRACIRPSVQQELDHEYVSAFCCEVERCPRVLCRFVHIAPGIQDRAHQVDLTVPGGKVQQFHLAAVLRPHRLPRHTDSCP